MLLTDCVLALLRRLIRVHLKQCLGIDEVNIIRQLVDRIRILVPYLMLHVLDDTEDHTYRTLEGRGVPVLLVDDHLPVPLIDIATVQIIELLIATNRVHVGIETLARLEAVLLQCHSLPLRQRMHDLDRLIRPPWNIEADRTLITVQIIIETRALRHEKRRRDTAEIHLPTELLLKCISDILDCLLCLTHRKTRIIILWNDQSHTYPLNPDILPVMLTPPSSFR